MPKMPKGRYKIMTAYMPKVGTRGLDMMYRTCTVQTNLDFSSEADMVKKLRVSIALQPVATALFTNSPFTEGKPNGCLLYTSGYKFFPIFAIRPYAEGVIGIIRRAFAVAALGVHQHRVDDERVALPLPPRALSLIHI